MTVDGAKVRTFDLMTSNGVVHVIDSVMIPPAGDIVTQLNDNFDFTTLVSKVTQAGLATALQGRHRRLAHYYCTCTHYERYLLVKGHAFRGCGIMGVFFVIVCLLTV